jgi:hypothetical protein
MEGKDRMLFRLRPLTTDGTDFHKDKLARAPL